MFKQYCAHDPVFVIIDVRTDVKGSPTTAYTAVEEIEGEGKEIKRVFKHISCSIEAEEAEEVPFWSPILSFASYLFWTFDQVGVEHLLRDINDPSTSTLAMQIKQKVDGLSGFVQRLELIRVYLRNVIAGRVPVNNQILYNLQNIFNMLPNLNVDVLVNSMLVKTNDMYLAIYLSALIRSVIALHGLLNNKIKFRDIDDILDRGAGVGTENLKSNGADSADKASPAKVIEKK